MAKMPDPVKKKAVKSAVAKKAAMKKAEVAESKASRGPVASKSRYPKQSTLKGATEAAKRGAGAARNKMGGFGKTAPRRAAVKGGTVRSAEGRAMSKVKKTY